MSPKVELLGNWKEFPKPRVVYVLSSLKNIGKWIGIGLGLLDWDYSLTDTTEPNLAMLVIVEVGKLKKDGSDQDKGWRKKPFKNYLCICMGTTTGQGCKDAAVDPSFPFESSDHECF